MHYAESRGEAILHIYISLFMYILTTKSEDKEISFFIIQTSHTTSNNRMWFENVYLTSIIFVIVFANTINIIVLGT